MQYGTTGCIFSRALFLESFDYVEASSGVYNFTEAEKDESIVTVAKASFDAGWKISHDHDDKNKKD